MHTTQRTGSKLAAWAAMLIGLLNIVLVIYVVATPAASRYDTGEFFTYFLESPLALSTAWIVFAVTALLSYAVIPAVADLLGDVDREWARVATICGLAGYTILGVWAITIMRRIPGLAQSFVSGDAATRAAILAYGLPEIDPDGWFSFGGPGTWLIVMNVLALRGAKLPKWHAVVGILLGLSHWATVFGALFGFEPLNLIASAGGALFYPIWFIGLGVFLLKNTGVGGVE